MSLEVLQKVSKMGPKWPQNGPAGALRASGLGHWGPFWAHFRPFWSVFRPFEAPWSQFETDVRPQAAKHTKEVGYAFQWLNWGIF